MGLLAVAILVANNLRDIPTDEAGGKRTLAVRLGDRRTRRAVPRVRRRRVRDDRGRRRSRSSSDESIGLTQWALIGLIAWPLAIRPMETRRHGDRPRPDPGAHRNGGDARRVRLLLALGSSLVARDFVGRGTVPVTWTTGRRLPRVRLGPGRRAGRRRGAARVRVAGLTLDAARAGARTSPGRHGARASGRTLERVLRARAREGARGAPVAIACTSGTAAAEFLPAVVEASQSRVPLLVLTADRPPRLRGTGANQTIDQVGLYGDVHARRASRCPCPRREGQDAWWRQAAREALDAPARRPAGSGPRELPLRRAPHAVGRRSRCPAPTGERSSCPAAPRPNSPPRRAIGSPPRSRPRARGRRDGRMAGRPLGRGRVLGRARSDGR